MSTERPAEEQVRRFRLTVAGICAYAAVALAVLPFAQRSGPDMPGLVPFFVAGVLVTELSTSFLLFDRFAEVHRWSVLLLAGAYFYSGLMAIAHLLTFPGAVLAGMPIIGTTEQSTAWIFILWIAGYALLAVAAIGLDAFVQLAPVPREAVRRAIGVSCFGIAISAIVVTLVTTRVPEALPTLMRDSRWSPLNLSLNLVVVSLLAASVITILIKLLNRDELYSWLALALTATAAANVLSGAGGGRYTLGWDMGRLSWVISACVLFLYFMRQFARQRAVLSRTNEILESRVTRASTEIETRLVTGLVAQLRGELTTERNGGAKVTLRFPYTEVRL
jgi:two-component system sensor histidine kinase/response regulator